MSLLVAMLVPLATAGMVFGLHSFVEEIRVHQESLEDGALFGIPHRRNPLLRLGWITLASWIPATFLPIAIKPEAGIWAGGVVLAFATGALIRATEPGEPTDAALDEELRRILDAA